MSEKHAYARQYEKRNGNQRRHDRVGREQDRDSVTAQNTDDAAGHAERERLNEKREQDIEVAHAHRFADADRMPIYLVRLVTMTSMIFTMPMPPPSKATPAMPLSKKIGICVA